MIEEGISSRKPYIKPVILHELELETRAGSPLSVEPLPDIDGWEQEFFGEP